MSMSDSEGKDINKRVREEDSTEKLNEFKKLKEEEPEKMALVLYEENMKAINRRVMQDLKKEMGEWKNTFFESMRSELQATKSSFFAEIKNELSETIRSAKEEIVTEVIDRIKKDNSIEGKNEKEMKESIKDLEWRAEMLERKEKKNNIVITGVKFNHKNVKEEAKEWLNDKLKIEVKIKEAWKLADEMSVLVLEDTEEKIKVFSNKKALKGTGIYINDDCTKKERKIQQEIKKQALEARKEGKKAIVKYKKMTVDGADWIWNEKEMKLFQKKSKDSE